MGGSGSQNGGIGTVYVGVIDPVHSAVSIAPEIGTTADGGAAATVTVVVRNRDNSPISNKPVEIAIASGANLNINGNPVSTNYVQVGTTDQNGTVTASLTTTTAGIRTLKARVEQTLL